METLWVTEDFAPNPEDIFDLTKLEAESLCQKASKAGLNTIILRNSRCFPESEGLMVFYRLYRGVSARDVANAHWLAINSTILGTEVFNISADSPFRQTYTAVLLNNPWQVIDRIYPQASRLYDQLDWDKPSSIDRVYVIDKAKRHLNYQPQDNFWVFLQSNASSIKLRVAN